MLLSEVAAGLEFLEVLVRESRVRGAGGEGDDHRGLDGPGRAHGGELFFGVGHLLRMKVDQNFRSTKHVASPSSIGPTVSRDADKCSRRGRQYADDCADIDRGGSDARPTTSALLIAPIARS